MKTTSQMFGVLSFALFASAPHVAFACSPIPSPNTVPQDGAIIPANAPAMGVTVDASELRLLGPFDGEEPSSTTPDRLLFRKETATTEPSALLEHVEGSAAMRTVPLSLLTPGNYQIFVGFEGSSPGLAARIRVAEPAPLPNAFHETLSIPNTNMAFVPQDLTETSCGTLHARSSYIASSLVTLPAALQPWAELLVRGNLPNPAQLSLGLAVNENAVAALSAWRNYACPMPAGLQSSTAELGVLGTDATLQLDIKDMVQGCNSASTGSCAMQAHGPASAATPVLLSLAGLGLVAACRRRPRQVKAVCRP